MCNFLAIKNWVSREDYVKANQIASYSIVVTEAFFAWYDNCFICKFAHWIYYCVVSVLLKNQCFT